MKRQGSHTVFICIRCGHEVHHLFDPLILFALRHFSYHDTCLAESFRYFDAFLWDFQDLCQESTRMGGSPQFALLLFSHFFAAFSAQFTGDRWTRLFHPGGSWEVSSGWVKVSQRRSSWWLASYKMIKMDGSFHSYVMFCDVMWQKNQRVHLIQNDSKWLKDIERSWHLGMAHPTIPSDSNSPLVTPVHCDGAHVWHPGSRQSSCSVELLKKGLLRLDHLDRIHQVGIWNLS